MLGESGKFPLSLGGDRVGRCQIMLNQIHRNPPIVMLTPASQRYGVSRPRLSDPHDVLGRFGRHVCRRPSAIAWMLRMIWVLRVDMACRLATFLNARYKKSGT